MGVIKDKAANLLEYVYRRPECGKYEDASLPPGFHDCVRCLKETNRTICKVHARYLELRRIIASEIKNDDIDIIKPKNQ